MSCQACISRPVYLKDVKTPKKERQRRTLTLTPFLLTAPRDITRVYDTTGAGQGSPRQLNFNILVISRRQPSASIKHGSLSSDGATDTITSLSLRFAFEERGSRLRERPRFVKTAAGRVETEVRLKNASPPGRQFDRLNN